MCDTDLIDAYDLAENGRGGGDPGPPVWEARARRRVPERRKARANGF